MSDKREAIDGMEALVAIVRAGSFTKAATALGMTQSGTSKMLARLEERLGVHLLQRGSASICRCPWSSRSSSAIRM